MTISCYSKTDKQPARVYLSPEKNTQSDRIVYSEVFFDNEDDNCITLYGILSQECSGLENYKDRNWKPAGEKVRLQVYKDKRPQWDETTKKFLSVPVSDEENYVFVRLRIVLNEFSTLSERLAIAIQPWINPVFLDYFKLPEAQKNSETAAERKMKEDFLASMVSNVVVACAATTTNLTDEDRKLAKNVESLNGSSSKYTPAETEIEKLNTRWKFVQNHLNALGEFKTAYDIALLLATKHSDPDAIESQRTLELTVELLKGLIK